MTRSLILMLFVFVAARPLIAQTVQEQFQAAVEASANGEYAQYLQIMLNLQESRPENSTVLYHLGLAQIKMNEHVKGLQSMKKALYRNAQLPIEEDSSLIDLRDSPAFDELRSLKTELSAQLESSKKAFEIESALLYHAEGIAYSKKEQKYYLGDVRKSQIIVYDPQSGSTSIFDQGPALHSIMGLRVDDIRGRLWVCSTPTPQMQGGLDKELKNQAFLLAYDLATQQLIRKYKVEGEGIWLGDLIVDKDGHVFLSSSSPVYPAIYRLGFGEKEVKEWLYLPNLRSMQGLVMDDSHGQLIVADYASGLYGVSLESKEVQKLGNETDHPLSGIDGLYLHSRQLIAIHNGLRPFRVVAYDLNEEGDVIENFKFLDRAIPGMNEPTLGVMVGSELHYVSNSPWPFYDADNQLIHEKRSPCLVRRIQLGQ